MATSKIKNRLQSWELLENDTSRRPKVRLPRIESGRLLSKLSICHLTQAYPTISRFSTGVKFILHSAPRSAPPFVKSFGLQFQSAFRSALNWRHIDHPISYTPHVVCRLLALAINILCIAMPIFYYIQHAHNHGHDSHNMDNSFYFPPHDLTVVREGRNRTDRSGKQRHVRFN